MAGVAGHGWTAEEDEALLSLVSMFGWDARRMLEEGPVEARQTLRRRPVDGLRLRMEQLRGTASMQEARERYQKHLEAQKSKDEGGAGKDGKEGKEGKGRKGLSGMLLQRGGSGVLGAGRGSVGGRGSLGLLQKRGEKREKEKREKEKEKGKTAERAGERREEEEEEDEEEVGGEAVLAVDAVTRPLGDSDTAQLMRVIEIDRRYGGIGPERLGMPGEGEDVMRRSWLCIDNLGSSIDDSLLRQILLEVLPADLHPVACGVAAIAGEGRTAEERVVRLRGWGWARFHGEMAAGLAARVINMTYVRVPGEAFVRPLLAHRPARKYTVRRHREGGRGLEDGVWQSRVGEEDE